MLIFQGVVSFPETFCPHLQVGSCQCHRFQSCHAHRHGRAPNTPTAHIAGRRRWQRCTHGTQEMDSWYRGDRPERLI